MLLILRKGLPMGRSGSAGINARSFNQSSRRLEGLGTHWDAQFNYVKEILRDFFFNMETIQLLGQDILLQTSPELYCLGTTFLGFNHH